MQKRDWTGQAEILKTLGHPVRLCIVAGLAEGSCNVGTMQECLGVPQSTVSQHLASLKAKGLVRGVRKGTQVCYEISDERIIDLVKLLAKM
jgi:ArsR family transcriptional regulator